MDNNSTPEQVWIPLEAQQGRLATLVQLSQEKGNPDFLGWFNRLLRDNNIPLSFDYEGEISNEVLNDSGYRDVNSVGELMDWCSNRTELFQTQRLAHFKPTRIEIMNGKVGLVCETNTHADMVYIPDGIKSIAVYPDQAWDDKVLSTLQHTTETFKDSMLYSCNIIAFICEPLF